MKYVNINGTFVVALITLISLSLYGCNNEGEELNEWNATYVYLQRTDYLLTNVKTFNLTHDPLGIEGDELSMTFTVNTQKPTMHDITVELASAMDIPELADAATLSLSAATIKAGEQTSEEITVTVDPQLFAITKKSVMCSLTVLINNVITKNQNTMLSPSQKMLSATIDKSSYSPVTSVMPTGWQAADRSGWVASASNNYAMPYQAAYAIDGDPNTSWFANGEAYAGAPCWLNIKLDTPIDMVGFSIIRENAFGGYDVGQAQIQIKKEGDSNWTSYGDVTYIFKPFNGTAPQYATMDEPIRNMIEFRLRVLYRTDFTGLGELSLYEKK